MTKSWLAYTVYDVRRAVTWQRKLLANPEQLLGRFRRLDVPKTQPSGPS